MGALPRATVAEAEVHVEIRDWLRSVGDRARLLVVVPLAAALIALLIAVIAPARYQATSTVILPDVSTTGPLASITAQRVADLMGAAKSEGVLDAVSAETGVPHASLGALSVSRSGTAGVMSIGFVWTDPAKARAVTEATARGALRALAQVNQDQAKAEVEATQALYDEAASAFTDAENKTGLVYSDRLLTQLQKRFTDARDRLNAATAAGDAKAIRVAQAAVDSLTARLLDAQQLQSLSAERQSALVSLFSARSRQASAEGDMIAAGTLTIATTRAAQLSKFRFVAQRVVLAGAFGFILAIGLLILLQLLRVRGAAESGETVLVVPRLRARAGAAQ